MSCESLIISEGEGARSIEHGEEVAHRVLRFDGVPEWSVDLDGVEVPATLSTSVEVAGLDQVRDDGLSRSLGDAYGGGDVASPDARVPIDADEDVGMVAQEGPLASPASLRRSVVSHPRSPDQYTKRASQATA